MQIKKENGFDFLKKKMGLIFFLDYLPEEFSCADKRGGVLEFPSYYIAPPVLQCLAVCCSVLQCVAVCCSVLQCVAVCCSVSQCVAVCWIL